MAEVRRASLLVLIVTVGPVVLALVAAGCVVAGLFYLRTLSVSKETTNNMKINALAIHAYHDNYRRFPDAFNRGGPVQENKSMWFHLLPFVGANEAWAKNRADDSIVNSFLSVDDPHLGAKAGKLNFAGNIRVFGMQMFGDANIPDKAIQLHPPGTIVKSGLTLGRMVDGTANTLMLSTRMSSCGTTEACAPIFTLINGDPDTPHGGFFGGNAVSRAPSYYFDDAPAMMYQIRPVPQDAANNLGERRTCINQPSGVAHNFNGDKLLVAHCDGSVRTVSPKMTPTTFARALCPSDGHLLGPDWNDK